MINNYNNSGSSSSNDHYPRIVTLCYRAGRWTLMAGSVVSFTFAATKLPFAEFPKLIVERIQLVVKKIEGNNDHAEILMKRVALCNQMMERIFDNLNDRVTYSDDMKRGVITVLEPMIDGFFQILEAIFVRCDKWLNKEWPKRLWSSEKYANEFKLLAMQLDDYMKVMTFGVVLFTAHNTGISSEESTHCCEYATIITGDVRSGLQDFTTEVLESLRNFREELAQTVESLRKRLGQLKRDDCDIKMSIQKLEMQLDSVMKERNVLFCCTKRKRERIAILGKELERLHDRARVIAKDTQSIEKSIKASEDQEHRIKTTNKNFVDAQNRLKKYIEDLVQGQKHLEAYIQKFKDDQHQNLKAGRTDEDMKKSKPLISKTKSCIKSNGKTKSNNWNLCSKADSSKATTKHIPASSLTWENCVLTVERVELFVDKLSPGNAPTLLGVIAAPLQAAGIISGYFAVEAASMIVGEDGAQKVAEMTKNSTSFLSHYWVTVTLSNKKECTLERTGVTDNAAETCETLESAGVHLYWDKNLTRGVHVPSRQTYCDFEPSVTLADLLVFCHNERENPYDMINNNCKHFCYNLLQRVFKKEMHRSFDAFTGEYNGTYLSPRK
jgi:hypothetical protein